MASAKIDYAAISTKAMNSPKVLTALEAKAKKVFDQAKAQVLNEFLNDTVTREIRGGPEASNMSGMLGGYGNLFSYIGFYRNEDPIQPIEHYIRTFGFSAKKSRVRIAKGTSSVTFQIKFPTIETIEALSKMPWEEGNSWVRGIEMGISGYSNYMYETFAQGRSGKGKQSRTPKDMATSFSPRRYLPFILDKVVKKFK